MLIQALYWYRCLWTVINADRNDTLFTSIVPHEVQATAGIEQMGVQLIYYLVTQHYCSVPEWLNMHIDDHLGFNRLKYH